MRKPYKDLSLVQLRSFHEVCRLGSYAEAARHLGLSTSTVWEQLQGLGRYFEADLLEAAHGRVRPTADGQTLHNLVLPLLAGLDSAKGVLREHRGRPPEHLTLVSGMRMLVDEVALALAGFRAEFPGVRVRCLHADDRRVEAMVADGEADLGLMLEPGPGTTPRPVLGYEPAYELDFLLVTPPGHPLLAKRGLTLADVLAHPLVLTAPGSTSRRRIDEALHRDDLTGRARVAAETNSAVLSLAYVRAGVGVAITTGHRRGFLGQGLGLRPLGDWFGVARYVFVRLRGAYLPPALGRFADLIREAARDDPPPRRRAR